LSYIYPRIVQGIWGGFMSHAEIKEMSTLERLQAMEMLWDSLVSEEKTIRSPAWHREILRSRKREIMSGKTKPIPLSRLKGLLHR